MKKSAIPVILLCMLNGCQNKTAPRTTNALEARKIVVYLKSILQEDQEGDLAYHLAMFDSNGDFAVDTLETVFSKKTGQPGTIQWKLAYDAGIKKITIIDPKSEKTVIFRNGVRKRTFGKSLELDLPVELPYDTAKVDMMEAYTIEYITVDGSPVIIDPYIRIPPPPTGP